MTKTYTYRDGGVGPAILRGMNRVGGLLESAGIKLGRFEPDAIIEAAIKKAGSSDFGGDSYREGLEIYCESLEAEGKVSAFGRIAIHSMLVDTLATRLRLEAWTKENPAAREEKVSRPLIIVGLPRTGTSLLSQLLALDPMVRAPLQWETRSPVPPSTLAGAADDPRIAECAKGLEGLTKINPAIQAMHPFGAMLAEECVPFLMLDLRTLGIETQALVPSYGKWLLDADMTPAYEQHKKALQALQIGQPTESWTLKTPNHLWSLETLLKFYPDARLIWTHRDPGPVVTSVTSLTTTMQRTFSDHVDPVAVGREWKPKLAAAVARGMAYDDQTNEDWCVHVGYAELMRDPLATVRRIYTHFGDEMTNLHERRVESWVKERHQSIHGRHGYDPADYGWSYEGLAEEFSDYQARFQIEPENR